MSRVTLFGAMGVLLWGMALAGELPAPGEGRRLGRDQVEMVFIPGGTFQQGARLLDLEALPDEHPVHPVTLKGFWLDRLEVTNAQFLRYVEATGYRQRDVEVPALRIRVDDFWRKFFTPGQEQHPVVAVSWDEAAAYCQWAGKRLPTESEWERAARGADRRRYPWGDAFDPSRLNINASQPGPVGMFPAGASPYGVQDLAGNVGEWTADWFERYPGNTLSYGEKAYGQRYKVWRGGSYKDGEKPQMLRVTARYATSPDFRTEFVGFRCVMDLDAAAAPQEKPAAPAETAPQPKPAGG